MTRKKACSPHVCVRSTAMLLLSNNPQSLQGPNRSHPKDITVDVRRSNQTCRLEIWDPSRCCTYASGVQLYAKTWHVALIRTVQNLWYRMCYISGPFTLRFTIIMSVYFTSTPKKVIIYSEQMPNEVFLGQ